MSNPASYVIDIKNTTKINDNYRWVLQTTKQMQLVFMSIKPGEEIGKEIHPNTTQFIRIEEGTGFAIINKTKYELNPSTGIFIPAGVKHNIINDGIRSLKLYTLYSPPMHKIGTIEEIKTYK